MQVADFDVDVDNLLSIEPGDDPDNPVHGRMRGTDIQKHVARFHQFTGPMSGCRLLTG